MRIFQTLDEFRTCLGQSIGTTPYLTISQEMINGFAGATLDHQWIHVDEERAARDSPFKTTIAHGFLTLSLAPRFLADLYKVQSVRMGVNYGAEKIRFTAPVPVGSRVCLSATLASFKKLPGGARIQMDCTFHIEGQEKPACVAQLISVLYE
jgi:acyl dehydratase